MKKYTVKENQELETIICNKCGKEIKVERGIAKEDVLSVEKRWGYFSNKDNVVHNFDLCEACYDEWIQTFKHPVKGNE